MLFFIILNFMHKNVFGHCSVFATICSDNTQKSV